MALLSNFLFNRSLLTKQLLLNFRNLKNVTYQFPSIISNIDILKATYHVASKVNFLFMHSVPISTSCFHHKNARFVWRLAKFSSTAFVLGHRQNSQMRRDKFAENVRVKFMFAKREARRKVHKKIDEIKENVLTIPNGLCVLRMVSTPILGYLVLSELYTASLGLFIFAGFTDLIDGYIARNFQNQQSMIGSFLDPAADKLLISTLFVTLTINGLIPVPLTSLIIFRDACLFGAGFYIRYVSLPPPKTLSRYFDMSFVTAKLSPTGISKANTLIQLSLVAASLAAPVFSFVDHSYLHILWYVTGTTTVLSAASYLYYKNSTYKLFKR